MSGWLIEEMVTEQDARRAVLEEAGFVQRGTHKSNKLAVAIRLHDVRILNNRKWFDLFGGADLRVDSLVVQGNIVDGRHDSCYSPSTFRFPRVKDGDMLPTDGLLVYYGWPRYFIDMAITISRDRGDSDSLATLIDTSTGGDQFQSATSGLVGLFASDPTAAAVMAAIAAGRVISDLAYEIIKSVSGSTIGLYRGSKLAPLFGATRQPVEGSFAQGDFTFWYSVEILEAP